MENYEVIKTIGRGTYGVALLVKDRFSGQPFVVKRISIEALSDEDRGRAMREVVLLANLRHPCIVVYHDSFIQDGELHIVMQYCEGGDLSQKMKEAREVGRFFGEAQIIDWLCQLCLALGFIHQRRVLHRDLKSQNVFLTRSNRIRLGDFGVARVLESTVDAARTTIGTPYSLSPEAYRGAPYNQKSDMWALGCLLYEICALKRAFDAPNLFSLMKEVVEGAPPPLPSCFSQELRGLVDRMLSKEPEDRLTADEILMLPFVAERLRRLALKDHEVLRVLPPAVAAGLGLGEATITAPPPLMTPGGQAAGLASPAPPSPSHTVVPRERLHRGDEALVDAEGGAGSNGGSGGLPPGAAKSSSRGRLHLPARAPSGRRDSATSVGGAVAASEAAESGDVSAHPTPLGPLRKTSSGQQPLPVPSAGLQSSRPVIQTLPRNPSAFVPQGTAVPPLRGLPQVGEEAAEVMHSPGSSSYTPVSAYRESGGSSSYSPVHASGLSVGGSESYPPAAAGGGLGGGGRRRGTADSDTAGFGGGGRRPTLEPLRHGSMGSEGASFDPPSRKGSGASIVSVSSPSSFASGSSANGNRIGGLAALLSARQAAATSQSASVTAREEPREAAPVAAPVQPQPQPRAFFPPSPRDAPVEGSSSKGGGVAGAHLYTGLASTEPTPDNTPRGLASDWHHPGTPHANAHPQHLGYHGSSSSSMAPGTSPARSTHAGGLNRPRSFYEIGPAQPATTSGPGLGSPGLGLHSRPPSFHTHLGGLSSHHPHSLHERVSEGDAAATGRSLPGSTAVSRRASRASMGFDDEGLNHPHAAVLGHLHAGPAFHGGGAHPYGSSSSSPAAVSRGSPYEELVGGGRGSRELSPRPSREHHYHSSSHYSRGTGSAGTGPDPWHSRSSISATVSAARREGGGGGGGSGTASVTASPPGPGSHDALRPGGGWDPSLGSLDPLALPEALEVDDSDSGGSPHRGNSTSHHGSAGHSGAASAAGSRRPSGIGRNALFGGDSGTSPNAAAGGAMSTHYGGGGRVSRRSSAVGFGSGVPSRKGSGSGGPDGGLPHPSQYYHLQPAVERPDEDDGDDDRPAGVELHSMLVGSPGRHESPTAAGRHGSRRSSGVADGLGALSSPRPTVTSLPARSPPQHLPPARLPHLSTGSLSLHGPSGLASPSLTQHRHAPGERGPGELSPHDAPAASSAVHSGSPSKAGLGAPHFTPRPFHFPSSRPVAGATPTAGGVGSPGPDAGVGPGNRSSLGASSATGSPSLAGLAQPPPFRRNSSGFSAAEEVGALPLPAASPRPASLSERFRRQSLPHLQAPGQLPQGSPTGSPLPRALGGAPLGAEPLPSSFLMSPSAFGHQQSQGSFYGGSRSSDGSRADAPQPTSRATGSSLASSPLASSVPPPRLQVPPEESPPPLEQPSRDSTSSGGHEPSPLRQATTSRGSGPSSATTSKVASPAVSPAVDTMSSTRSGATSSSGGGGAAWQQVAAFASQPLQQAVLASPTWATSPTAASNNAAEGGPPYAALVSPSTTIQPLLASGSASSPPEAVWTPPNLALGGSSRGLGLPAAPAQLHTRLLPFTPAGQVYEDPQGLGIQEDNGPEDTPGLSIYPAQAGMFVIRRGGRQRLAPLSAGGGHPNARTSRVLPGGIVGTPVAPGPFVVAGTAPSLSRQSTGTMPTSATAMESPAASLLFRGPFSPSLPAATPRGLGGIPPLPGRASGLPGTKAAALQRLTLPSVSTGAGPDGWGQSRMRGISEDSLPPPPAGRGLAGVPSPARADTLVGGGAGSLGGLPPLGGLRPTTGLPMLRKSSAGTIASLSSDSFSGGQALPAFGGSAAPSRQLSGVTAISSASSDAEYSGSTLRRPWTVGHATLGGLGGVTSSPGGVEVYDAIVSGGMVSASPPAALMSRQNSDVMASPWWEAAAAGRGATQPSLDVDLPLSLDGTPVSSSRD